MNHEEFLEKYKDIVFIPTVLDPPPFDHGNLIKWIKDNPQVEHEYYCKKFNVDISLDEFLEMKWGDTNFTTFFKSYYVCDYQMGWWHEGFNTAFPEVLEWAKTIPTKPGKRIQFGVVTQRSLATLHEHKRQLCSSIHTDESDVGLRWFINNKNNNLFFYKTKKPVKEIIDGINLGEDSDRFQGARLFNLMTDDNKFVLNETLGIPRPNEFCFPDPIQINVDENTGWFLNQHQSAHAIAHEINNPDKVTIILDAIGAPQHKWDWDRLDKIMQDSLETHRDKAIFLQDF